MMDRLFDLVMYQLYELTEEEISIVERKVTPVTLYNPIILWYTFLCHHRSPSYSRSRECRDVVQLAYLHPHVVPSS